MSGSIMSIGRFNTRRDDKNLPTGSPRTCSEDGRENRNCLVSWDMI